MFELFEHTADLGLRIRARDLPALFREAARGLFAVIAGPAPSGAVVRTYAFELEGERYDFLLLDWLGELLYRFETDRVLLGDFRVSLDDRRLLARASAFELDGERELREVKAITYHGLTVEQRGDEWFAEIIVDI